MIYDSILCTYNLVRVYTFRRKERCLVIIVFKSFHIFFLMPQCLKMIVRHGINIEFSSSKVLYATLSTNYFRYNVPNMGTRQKNDI